MQELLERTTGNVRWQQHQAPGRPTMLEPLAKLNGDAPTLLRSTIAAVAFAICTPAPD
jgi:hypothetical protein